MWNTNKIRQNYHIFKTCVPICVSVTVYSAHQCTHSKRRVGFNMQMLLQIENVYGHFSKKARNW